MDSRLPDVSLSSLRTTAASAWVSALAAALLAAAAAGLLAPRTATAQPSTPEAAQFETVNTTDLVNLPTGDFAYSVPLMEVPGPEGGYPINLSYHSGVGPNQDATWVGLGWSLNPGTINRIAKGYPDEHAGAPVVSTSRAEGEEQTTLKSGVYYMASFGQVGFNMSLNLNTGTVGANMSLMLSPAKAGGILSPKAGLTVGTSGFNAKAGAGIGGQSGAFSGGASAMVSTGTQGTNASVNAGGSMAVGGGGLLETNTVGANVSAGTRGLSAGGSVGRSGIVPEARRSVGFTVSGDGSVSGNFTAGQASGSISTGFSTSSIGRGTVESWGFQMPVFVTPDGWMVTLGISQKQWTLDEINREAAFGYAQLTDYFDEPDRTIPDGFERKFDRHRRQDMLYTAPDHYQVSAQGLSGTFRAFHRRGYELIDNEDNQGLVAAQTSDDSSSDVSDDCEPRYPGDCAEEDDTPQFETVYRFTNDTGGNYTSEGGDEQITSPNGKAWYGSKKIEPYYKSDAVKEEILGFVVTTASGKRYVYDERVQSLFQFNYTKNEDIGEEEPLRQTTQKGGIYPSQWRLTAVLGPDYVDRGKEGLGRVAGMYEVDPSGIGAEDWGYWVKFNYQQTDLPRLWRTPWSGMSVSPRNADVTTYSWGLREETYLESIETATHIARFERTESKIRNLPPGRRWVSTVADPSTEDFNIYEEKITTSNSEMTFYFPGDFSQMIDNADLSDAIIVVAQDIGGFTEVTKAGVEGYRFADGFTRVRVSKDRIENAGVKVDEVTIGALNGESLFPPNYIEGQKLTRVELREKESSRLIKRTRLRYDYSLRGLTRGSDATVEDGAQSGTLTLRSVSFEGRNGATITPPYQFEYANNSSPGDGLNPRWKDDAWDRWGSYRPEADNGAIHLTPQDEETARKAAAWSLTKVTTPTGAQIEVDYESDTYRRAAQSYDVEYVEDYSINIDASRDPDDGKNYLTKTLTLGVSANPGEKIDVGDEISVVRYGEVTRTADGPIAPNPLSVGIAGEAVETVEVEDISGSALTLDEAVLIQTASIDSLDVTDVDYDWTNFVRWSPPQVYGGGSRVREISTITGIDTMTTTYRYRRPNGNSSGVASTLPERHSESPVRDTSLFDFAKVYNNTAMSHRRPSPSVLYDRVSVINVGPDNAPLNGKTVYEYYTASDHPYEEDKPYCSGCVFEDRSGIYGRPQAITHYEEVGNDGASSIDSDAFRPVKRRTTRYKFGRDIAREEHVRISAPDQSERSVQVGEEAQLGLSEEIFGFVNFNPSDDAPDRATLDGVYQGTATHRTYVPYAVGSTVKEFVYDSPNDTDGTAMATTTRHLMWDARTGATLASASQKSDGSWSVTKKTPAHWIYPGMLAKHQLSQNAKEVTYRSDETDLDARDIRDYSFDDTDVVDASVTTWSNDFVIARSGEVRPESPVWRKNDTYGYNPTIAAQGDGSVSFTMWNEGTNAPYPEVTADQPWEMTSNVTKYDRFSHSVETKSEDGTYSSKIYGHGRAEVVAVAKKARQSEIAATSFEDLSSGSVEGTLAASYDADDGPASARLQAWTLGTGAVAELTQADVPGGTGSNAAHTGRQYLSLRSAGTGRAVVTRTVSVSEPGVYRLTAWTQGSAEVSLVPQPQTGGMGGGNTGDSSEPQPAPETASQTFQTGELGEASSVAEVGGWTLQVIDVRITDANAVTAELAAIGGTARFDAVRIHPADARMKTFAYAPLTRNVTAMTGPNHRTTYFEYDDAGRLIRVRDREGSIKKQHRYFAASVQLTADGSEGDEENDGYTLSAEGSYGPIETYRWSYEGNTATGKTVDVSLGPDQDRFTAALELVDANGKVRARQRRTFTNLSEPPTKFELTATTTDQGDIRFEATSDYESRYYKWTDPTSCRENTGYIDEEGVGSATCLYECTQSQKDSQDQIDAGIELYKPPTFGSDDPPDTVGKDPVLSDDATGQCGMSDGDGGDDDGDDEMTDDLSVSLDCGSDEDINNQKSVVCTAYVSGGSGSYTYDWTKGKGCTGGSSCTTSCTIKTQSVEVCDGGTCTTDSALIDC